MAIEEKKFLGTAGVQQLIANTRSEIATAEQNAKDYADSLADNYDAAGTAQTKVDALANGQVKTNTEHIGTMDNLETTAKDDLVSALNEVRNAVSAGGTAAAMTMTEQTTGLGDGIAKAYVLKQGENTVGTINIPKDMVVQSGSVVTNPEGQAEGTYIKLVLANATNDEIFVNVGNLVDIYKAKESAAQVQVAIDSATREISASIVAGSVTATELAADAVVTAKIADGNVTKAKLSTEVQGVLTNAEADHQSLATVVDETIPALDERIEALEGVDHEHANATQLATYDKTQAELLAAAKSEAEGLVNAADSAMNTRVEALEAIDHDHSNKTVLDSYDKTQATLISELQGYADSKVEGVDLSGIATNAEDIDKLEASLAEGGATANAIAEAKKAGTDASAHADELNTAMNTRVEALEAVSYVEISATEINNMFTTE